MQGYTKTIICLAKSRRPGGVCVAGREINEGQIGPWIRPVTDAGAIPPSMLNLNGGRLELGDVVEIGLKQPKLHRYQAENHLVDLDRPWRRLRRASVLEIEAAVQAPSPLWYGFSSTKNGKRDKVPVIFSVRGGGSLRFIEVHDLSITSKIENESDSVRKTRGNFTYAGSDYRLTITDYGVQNTYGDKPEGVYQVGRAYLCISLSDALDGIAYKLIAAVITPQN